MSQFTKELEVAIRAVSQAAKVCRSVQSAITPDVLEKKDRSPVTVADFTSQAIVSKTLLDAFPNDPMIGEEDSSELRTEENQNFLGAIQRELSKVDIEASEDQIYKWIDHGGTSNFQSRFWTLDPIDGTKGFLRKEQYAISLALIVDGQIQVAVLGCPNLNADSNTPLGLIFSAVRGDGAYVHSFETPEVKREISTSHTIDSSSARFVESVESGHSSHSQAAEVATLLCISEEPVRLDSQAKYAVVARGEAEIYLRLPTRKDYQEKIWDHAGGVLVVEEAGGTVSDVTGAPLDFTHGRELATNRGVVVTNSHLHKQVIDALKTVGVE